MKLFVLVAVLLLALSHVSSAGFTYLYSINGTNQDDSDAYFKFYEPTGVLYHNGTLYVADSGKRGVYVMNNAIRQRALLTTGSDALFENPLRMSYDNGYLYVADGLSTIVRTYGGDGSNVNEWNSKIGSNLKKASGVALDSQFAYITDMAEGRLYVYNRTTRTYVRVGIDKGASDGLLAAPSDVEIYGDRLFVSDQGKGLIFAYSRNLTFLYAIGRGVGGEHLISPRGFEIYEGRIYVADSSSNQIVVFTLDGYPVDKINDSVPDANLSNPEDVAVGDGKAYVADSGSRLVKVFELNTTVGNDSVAQLIAGANRSLAQLYVLAPAAQKLNLIFAAGNAAFGILSAQSSYDNFMFADAAALAQKSLDETVALQLNLSQAVELRAKQLSRLQVDRVAEYRKLGLAEPARSKLLQFDNMVTDINAKLAGRAYGLAADTVLLLPSIADSYITLVTESEKMEARRQQNQTASSFSLQISALQLRLSRLNAQAAIYRQSLNLSGAGDLLAAASKSAGDMDYDSANRSIGLADFEISAQETLSAHAAGEIDKALANLSVIEFNFNSSTGRPVLLPPDLEPERESLAAAREIAYSNPMLATAMGQKAADSAALKIKNSSAVSTAASAVLVMLALIGVIALAFSFHIYSRRKKMRDARQKKGEPTHIIWKE